MQQCILSIGTITYAIRARKLLAASRISARIVKTTSGGRSSGGCTYGVEIDAADMLTASGILSRNQIPFEWSRAGQSGRLL